MAYRECLNQWAEETCPCSNHPQGHHGCIQHSELLCSKNNSGGTASACGLSTGDPSHTCSLTGTALFRSSQHPREAFAQFLREAVRFRSTIEIHTNCTSDNLTSGFRAFKIPPGPDSLLFPTWSICIL